MVEYLVILLDDTSTSYCHYNVNRQERKLIELDLLKKAIVYGMKQNLMIQLVYPDYELPASYKEVIETIDHSKIVPATSQDSELKEEADVVILNGWESLTCCRLDKDQCYAIRTTKEEFLNRYALLNNVLGKVKKLNVVITDIDSFSEDDFSKYKEALAQLAQHTEACLMAGETPLFNLLTDRFMVTKMNNCDAGWKSIAVAPNGKFYVCPAFYFEDESDTIGDLWKGLNIKNQQLYRLDHAPICRHCDAFQCRRCIWLNRKTTLEVNTPSHEQCVVAHLERNASKALLEECAKKGNLLSNQIIEEISYLDPFDNRKNWVKGMVEE